MKKREEQHGSPVQSSGNSISRRSAMMIALAQLARRSARAEPERWVVNYSSREPIEAFRPYSCLILDSRYHPPLKPLAKLGKKLIGYVSLGEASSDYSYFNELKSQRLLVQSSTTWRGNQYIDIRDTRWLRRLSEEIVPLILQQGFHGLFLDTLDSALYLEHSDRVKYSGMGDAAVAIVKDIRRNYPSITLVMNRAYSLLEHVGGDINVALGESVYTTFDFQTRKYRLVESTAYEQQVRWLQNAASSRPALRVFTLDYWESSDTDGIARIYRKERANGFLPYVATIDLTKIVAEPGL